MRWFRLYEDLLNDPKVQGLAPPLFKAWVNILCLASKGKGIIPPATDVAFGLRCTPAQATRTLDTLVAAGLLDREAGGVLRPHNWDQRQWKSDDSLERVRAFRERHKKRDGNGDGSDHVTVTETAQETEQIQRAEQTTENPPSPSGSSPPKSRDDFGTRLQSDWLPSPEGRKYAIEQGFFPSDLPKVIDKFRAHFATLPGRKGLSADWSASWVKWVLDEARIQKVKPRLRVEGEQPADSNIFVHFDTEAGRAWMAYYLRVRGRKPMEMWRQGRPGFYFPSEFPPDHKPAQSAPMEPAA